ncbi:hypothetical protein CGJ34_23530 [Vibrio parahaemolyticus]|nr:hypothetical protein [Vibrio parahaemolyticus]TOE80683.1 hypothetical protein CGJ34_23530 [Vibrio parahaemolyticus]
MLVCFKLSREKATNKAFKSDSQRLAVSLRSSIAKRCSHLNAALCAQRKIGSDKRNGYLRLLASNRLVVNNRSDVVTRCRFKGKHR